MSLLSTVLLWLLYLIIPLIALKWLCVVTILVAAVASLVDSLQARRFFLRQVRNMQYEHLEQIYHQEQQGENVRLTPTFSEPEKKYLKKQKRQFLLTILLKLALTLMLFFLLFRL